MRRIPGLILLLIATALAARSAGEVDLGEGLGYVRIRDLDATAPAMSEPARKAIVIDLRAAAAPAPEGAARLRAMVDVSARGQLRLVLIDSETAPVVLSVLETRGRSVLTVASGDSKLKPDVAVAGTAEADRKAREAIDAGRPIAELIGSRFEKRRYDEAAMVRDHNNGVPIPDGPPETVEEAARKARPEGAPATGAADGKATPVKPVEPYDAVLQRAIHLHRALKELGRI